MFQERSTVFATGPSVINPRGENAIYYSSFSGRAKSAESESDFQGGVLNEPYPRIPLEQARSEGGE